MVSRSTPLMRAIGWASLLLLAGCHGQMTIDGLPGSADGTGDGPPGIDYGSFDGVDITSVDWGQAGKAQGREDCEAIWDAVAAETTDDDHDLCPVCDHVWSVNLRAQADAQACLADTELEYREAAVVRVGFEFTQGVGFMVWRTLDDADGPLVEVGVGALDGTEFTWSGRADHQDSSLLGYSWFHSGEGEF
jgi:hypothetical protein